MHDTSIPFRAGNDYFTVRPMTNGERELLLTILDRPQRVPSGFFFGATTVLALTLITATYLCLTGASFKTVTALLALAAIVVLAMALFGGVNRDLRESTQGILAVIREGTAEAAVIRSSGVISDSSDSRVFIRVDPQRFLGIYYSDAEELDALCMSEIEVVRVRVGGHDFTLRIIGQGQRIETEGEVDGEELGLPTSDGAMSIEVFECGWSRLANNARLPPSPSPSGRRTPPTSSRAT